MNEPYDSMERQLRLQLEQEVRAACDAAPAHSIALPAAAQRRARMVWLAAAAAIAVIAGAALLSRMALSDGGQPSPAGPPVATESSSPQPTESPSATAPGSKCAVFPPRQLLDGSTPGEPTTDSDGTFSWGSGALAVHQAPGEDALGISGGTTETETITGERITGYAINVGDPGVGEVAFAFTRDGCDYTVWLPAGTTMNQLRSFVRNY